MKGEGPFFKGTTKRIRMAFLGFIVALVGALIGFAGYSIKPIAYIAFFITGIGVSIGFVATFTNHWNDK